MSSLNKITLREFKMEDAEEIAILCNNMNIWNNVKDFFPHPYTKKDAVTYIESCIFQNPTTTYAIDYNGKLVGTVGLVLQSDVYRLSAELGYWIGEPYWGLGIATEAVKQIVEIGFNNLGLIRIFSGVFEHNTSSMRVLEKAGFTKECIARKAIIKNGKILDGHRYAILNC